MYLRTSAPLLLVGLFAAVEAGSPPSRLPQSETLIMEILMSGLAASLI